METIAQLLSQDALLVYTFVLIVLVKPTNLVDKQKIFLTYMITFFLCKVGEIGWKEALIIHFIVMFFYFEFFSNSTFKMDIMTNIMHKFVDCIYVLLTEYGYIRFFILLLVTDNKLNKTWLNDFVRGNLEIYIVQGGLILWLAYSIYRQAWQIKPLDEIKAIIERECHIYQLSSKINEYNLEIVTRLEDKSYYKRKTLGSAFSGAYLKYIGRKATKILKHEFGHFIKSEKSISDAIIKMRDNDSVKRYFKSLKRGHSTIEAQTIRSIGIQKGYRTLERGEKFNRKVSWFILLLKRKSFEIIYSAIIFRNLENYYKGYKYPNSSRMKDYILLVYLMNAQVKINNKSCIGLKKLYDKNIECLTEDELFIGTLAMSKYHLDVQQILFYAERYNYYITEERVSEILKYISQVADLDNNKK